MKIVKVIFDNSSSYVLDILNELEDKIILETYNVSLYKEKKLALPIMTRFGTKQVPLLVFMDENLIEYAAHWAESNEEITVDLINKYINNYDN